MAALLVPRQSVHAMGRMYVGSGKRLFSTVVDVDIGTNLPIAPSYTASALHSACQARAPRNNWSKDDIRAIYNTPLMELAFKSV